MKADDSDQRDHTLIVDLPITVTRFMWRDEQGHIQSERRYVHGPEYASNSIRCSCGAEFDDRNRALRHL